VLARQALLALVVRLAPLALVAPLAGPETREILDQRVLLAGLATQEIRVYLVMLQTLALLVGQGQLDPLVILAQLVLLVILAQQGRLDSLAILVTQAQQAILAIQDLQVTLVQQVTLVILVTLGQQGIRELRV
jgi:hypothetical protein